MWYADVPMMRIRRLIAKRAGDSEREQVYRRRESPNPCLCQHGTGRGVIFLELKFDGVCSREMTNDPKAAASPTLPETRGPLWHCLWGKSVPTRRSLTWCTAG
jgi:hypothetical protein